MNNLEKYLKISNEYAEESFKKWGYYYPPLTWEDFHKCNQESFEKYLKKYSENNDDSVMKTVSYLTHLNDLDIFGFYIAFQNEDYETLNNVLYQTSRRGILHLLGGSNQGGVLYDGGLSAFACNDFEIIPHYFPKGTFSADNHYLDISLNILKVLHYRENDMQEEIVQKTNTFLNKKLTAWARNFVLYFLSVLNRDYEEASKCLQELCSAYQKFRLGISYEKLIKCFASNIHGLYRFARLIDEDFFRKIIRPAHPSFLENFEIWQEKNNYPKGKLFYEYPEELNYMNDIFKADLPFIVETPPKYAYEKRLYIDLEKFAEDLTENTLKYQSGG
jgi:hypothetical protein